MRNRHRRRGFTLVELLVVIGIIAVLLGLLVPVVNKVRTSAYTTSTKNLMQSISAAATNYHLAFKAYPGLLPNKAYDYGTDTPGNYFTAPTVYAFFTQSEDLVVCLTGGILKDLTNPASKLDFDAAYLGQGPVSFNPLNPDKKTAFIAANPSDLSPVPPAGIDNSTAPPKLTLGDPENGLNQTFVKDSKVPEFMDKFPEPRPIIYVRANPGAVAGSIVNNGYNQAYHYNYKAVAPYLNFTDDAETLNNKKQQTGTLSPEVIAYFTGEQSNTSAKYAGTYLLIAAGPDRKFGTSDDLITGGGGAQ